MKIRPFHRCDTPQVIELWKLADLSRPWNDPQLDIERKFAVQSDLFLVGVLDDAIVATVMAGYDGHRGWINYLAVHPNHQRKGLGRVIMNEAQQRLQSFGCPKLNLQIRRDNLAAIQFYKQLGFQIDDVISMGKRLD